MTHTRIAFVGGLRAGKDTASDWLVANCAFQRISISETVKATVYAAFKAAGLNTKDKGFMRAPLQDGGLAARGVDPEVWVGSLVRRFKLDNEENTGRFVCSDVRYPNEADMLRSRGFVIVRVEANRDVREARAKIDDGNFDPSVFDHPSETEMSAIQPDLIIRNETPEDRDAMFATLRDLVTDCA